MERWLAFAADLLVCDEKPVVEFRSGMAVEVEA